MMAADSNITLLGYLPIGYCNTIAPISERYLAIGSGRGVRIMDVTDKTHPFMASEITSGGEVSDITASGNYLYVATQGAGYYVSDDFTAGLIIVDVSDPVHPQTKAFYQTDAACTAVAVAGNYAYVANSSNLLVLDISNPQSPTKVGSLYVGASAKDEFCDGAYLYVSAQSQGTKIYDLNDPAHPNLIGTISYGSSSGISVSDTVAVLSGLLHSVSLYSVSDASHPQELSQIISDDNKDNYYSATISGHYLFLSGSHSDNGSQFMFKIYDISNPGNPVLKSTYYDESGRFNSSEYGREISVQNGIAFVAAGNGLRVIQTNDLENPDLLSVYETNMDANDVQISNNLAYFTYNMVPAGMAGFSIIDVSDPTCLHERGYLYLKPYYSGMTSVAVSNGYAYIEQSVPAPDSARGIHVINIADPGNPQEARFIAFQAEPKNIIAADGNYVYAETANMDTIRIYDISDHENPLLVGKWGVNPWDYGYPNSYLLSGTNFYVGTTKGLLIFDRSNPASLNLLGFYTLPANYYGVNGVAVRDQKAYLATQNGLLAIDISDPANPVLIADNSDYLSDVTLIGGDIYAANPGQGLRLYHLSESTFRMDGYYDNKNYRLNKLTACNDLIYATYEGLMIFRKGPATGIGTGQKITVNGFHLKQNYPNPFNPETNIRFSLGQRTRVKIVVYNAAGQKVAQLLDAVQSAGSHQLKWQAGALSSGIYFIQMQAGTFSQVRKAFLLK